MPFLLLPLAWIEELAPLLLVIFWVIRQIMSAAGGKAEQLEADEEENPRRKPLTPEQQAQKQSVEQFLREIGAVPDNDPEPIVELEPIRLDPITDQKNQAGFAAAEAAPGVERISVRPIDSHEEPQPRKPQPSRAGQRKKSQPLVATKKRPNQSPKRHTVVESHLAENASHLGEQIGQTDERLEARLHDKFDHRLGNLRHREATPAEESGAKQKSQAARILELLSSPSGVRDAIVLNEILKPPVDRWD